MKLIKVLLWVPLIIVALIIGSCAYVLSTPLEKRIELNVWDDYGFTDPWIFIQNEMNGQGGQVTMGTGGDLFIQIPIKQCDVVSKEKKVFTFTVNGRKAKVEGWCEEGGYADVSPTDNIIHEEFIRKTSVTIEGFPFSAMGYTTYYEFMKDRTIYD